MNKNATLLARAKFHWPLWVVLAVQVALTVHGLGNSPNVDESLYLRAGSEEWSHWILHTPESQNFESYFSGAPFLWPPLGAIGFSLGGVAGARIITILLLLGVTSLIYFTGLRLSNHLVAGFSAAFAGLTGLASFIGTSATFEPLAMFFLTLAVYSVVRAQGRWSGLAAAGVALTLANFSKYGTIAWDVIVFGIAVLYGWESWKPALRRLIPLVTVLIVGDGLLLLAGGSASWQGMKVTTIARSSALASVKPGSPSTVIFESATLVGIIFILALFGIVMSRVEQEPWSKTALLSVMTVSVLITPIDQARLHELGSLDRNMAIGLPIAALAAGFGAAYGVRLTRRLVNRNVHEIVLAAWTLPIAILLIIGMRYPWPEHYGSRASQIASFIQQHYRTGTYVASLRPNDVLSERLYISDIPNKSWVNTRQRSFIRRLRSDQISVIVLNYWIQRPTAEHSLIRTLHTIRGWSLCERFGFGKRSTQVWCYRPRVAKKKPA